MSERIQIGRYELLEKLATGGMAEIFLGKLIGAEGFEKYVVIKRILPHWSSSKDFASMMIDEAKIVVQLNHPHIVQVYELGREKETYYIAMEYIEGVDTRQLFQKSEKTGPIPMEISFLIITDVLSALAYAHSKKDMEGHPLGIIHRDISPQNILLSFDGTVKLTDFGIAKATSRSQETMTGVLKGKFAYMSPEQASGFELTPQSDLFAVAIVFYELLTGERLFRGRTDLDTLEQVRRSEIRFPPEAEKKIPPPVKEILLKALAKEPEHRYRDATEFRKALLDFSRKNSLSLSSELLEQYLHVLFGEEIENRRTRTYSLKGDLFSAERTARFHRRRRSLWKRRVLFLAVTSLIVGGGLYLWKGFPFKKPAPVVAVSPEAGASPSQGAVGYLSVQAIPWGYVKIDGTTRLETPVRRHPLKTGKHQIGVYYEPGKRVFETILDIQPNRHTTCLANFKSKEGIQCH